MNGMRTGSAAINELTADVMKRIGFERAEADSQLYAKEGSTARIAFHVDGPILVASKEETEQVWRRQTLVIEGQHVQHRRRGCEVSGT